MHTFGICSYVLVTQVFSGHFIDHFSCSAVISSPALREAQARGVYFADVLFFLYIFSDFWQTDYLNI